VRKFSVLCRDTGLQSLQARNMAPDSPSVCSLSHILTEVPASWGCLSDCEPAIGNLISSVNHACPDMLSMFDMASQSPVCPEHCGSSFKVKDGPVLAGADELVLVTISHRPSLSRSWHAWMYPLSL